ncbi:MAG: arabinogalactan oligomer / maltooligosaccharide transport system permease protein [Clostridiales bacterium]|jgi:arabinogalactan oligomer/maltooligosaccharide transport system permease protein|nr:arabinogalactan oligomer / maltooligosaccharide transport system permease protein [Clostridiales bacterium]
MKLTLDGIKSGLLTVLIHLLLMVTAILILLPVIWIIVSSLNPGDTLLATALWPKKLTLFHYQYLWEETDYKLWYFNTLKVATANMFLSTALILPAAYAFSRFRFKGRRLSLMTLLVLQMFPSFMGMVAVYVLLNQFGLLDSHLGLVLVYAGGAIPYGTWMVKGYFDSIPRSMEEAARIDGATNTQTFIKIVLPLSYPIVTFTMLNNFVGPWLDFIFARLVLRSDCNKTLAVGLFEMVTGIGNTKFTTFAAGAVLVAVPITLCYMFLQRYLILGLAAGAIKE